MDTHTRLIRYDVGFDVPGDRASHLAMEVHWPAHGKVAPLVWICVPGGGMNRRFYDLEGGDGEFSFARQMAARGFASVLLDPPGIGDSDRPQDGYALTPDRLAAIVARGVKAIQADLVAGKIAASLPPIPGLQTVGVGHSMGALLTVVQQAGFRLHTAVALLGFGLDGLPDYLPPEVRELATDREAVRAQLVPLAKKMFELPYPEVSSRGGGDIYAAAAADREAVKGLARARAELLPVPALLSILPGNVAPEAAVLDVPVYLAVGERDLIAPAADAAIGFSASPQVKQQILAGAGHSFFLFPARTQLFDGLADWARGLVTMG